MNKNNYLELVNSIKSLSDGKYNFNNEEKNLMNDLLFLVQMNKGCKISERLFIDNRKFTSLIESIDITIREYKSKIKDSLNNIDKLEELNNKIYYYNNLRSDIISFCNRQTKGNYLEINNFINKCISSLNFNGLDTPRYFGLEIGTINRDDFSDTSLDYNINYDLVNYLYNILGDEKFIYELREGVSIRENNKSISRLLETSREAISYENLVYSNISDIITYNRFSSVYNHLISRTGDNRYNNLDLRINHLERRIRVFDNSKIYKLLHKDKYLRLINDRRRLLKLKRDYNHINREIIIISNQLKKLEDKFNSVGIINIFNSNNTGNYSLKENLLNIYSLEELDSYYNEIYRLKDELDNKKHINNRRAIRYESRVSKDTISFINDHYDTAYNIAKLSYKSREGVSGKVALFALKSYNDLMKYELEDMGISDKDYASYNNYYKDVLKNGYTRFNELYVDILNNSHQKVYKR